MKDIHTPQVEQLVAASDWSGLVRYWIAHGHDDALRTAIEVVQALGAAAPGEVRWDLLAVFLAEVRCKYGSGRLDWDRPDGLLDRWPLQEKTTILLLWLLRDVLLATTAEQAPLDLQVELLQVGIASSTAGCRLAELLVGEERLVVLFLAHMAQAYVDLDALSAACEAYQQALAIARELASDQPDLYQPRVARTLVNLGNVRWKAGDPRTAADEYAEALGIFKRLAKEQPLQFTADTATATMDLANAHHDLGLLESARDGYGRAVAIYRDLYANSSDAHMRRYRSGLGLALRNSASLEWELGHSDTSRRLCEEALTVLGESTEASPAIDQLEVALTLHCLALNQEAVYQYAAARAGLTRALGILDGLAKHRRDFYRGHIAEVRNTLANLQRTLGELENAADGFADVLTLYLQLAETQPTVYRPFVARSFRNLGAVYTDLDKLQPAIDFYRNALHSYRELAGWRPKVYTKDLSRTLNGWGALQRKLGRRQEAAETFIEALALCRGHVQEQPETLGPDLALTLTNLGVIEGDLGEIEHARSHCLEALDVCRGLTGQRQLPNRHLLATVLSNLGSMLRNCGDLGAAQSCYTDAISFLNELPHEALEAYGSLVATAHMGMGTVLRELDDPEGARRGCVQALAILSKASERTVGSRRAHMARVLHNVGSTLMDLGNPDNARQAFMAALRAYRELEGDDSTLYAGEAARAQVGLGASLRDAGHKDAALATHLTSVMLLRRLAADDPCRWAFDLAIGLQHFGRTYETRTDFRAALKCYSEAGDWFRKAAENRAGDIRAHLAMSMYARGEMLAQLRDMRGARDSVRQAAQLFEELATTHPASFLRQRVGCWYHLGQLLLRRSRADNAMQLVAARDAFRRARYCAESVQDQIFDTARRWRIDVEFLRVYEALLTSNIRMCDAQADKEAIGEAVDVAEAMRSHHLTQLLAEETRLPMRAPLELVESFISLRRRVRHATRRLHIEDSRFLELSFGEPSRVGLIGGGDSWHVAQSDHGLGGRDHVSEALRVVEQAEKQLAGLRGQYETTLVQIRAEYDRTFNPDQVLPPVSNATIQKLIPTDVPTAMILYVLMQEGGVAFILTQNGAEAIKLPGLNTRKAEQLAASWIDGHAVVHKNKWRYEEYDAAWERYLGTVLAAVATYGVRPIIKALMGRGIKRLIMVPHQSLHVFPLHVCRLSNGRCLADEYEVVYCPSLSLLQQCSTLGRHKRKRALAVADPTQDLPFASLEASRMARYYKQCRTIRGAAATREELIDRAATCHVWHHTGHAVFDAEDQLNSALVLGTPFSQERWLTLRSIFCDLHLRDCQLVILSGCESGAILPDPTDEYVGLASGFLCAGAACVVSSQWAVGDLASALVMDRFHREWHAGLSIGGALREAQRWLREDIPSGPYLEQEVLTPEFLECVSSEEEEVCRKSARLLAKNYPTTPPFSSPARWAPFVAIGMSFPLPAPSA